MTAGPRVTPKALRRLSRDEQKRLLAALVEETLDQVHPAPAPTVSENWK
jgi:hypothetical protein